MVTDTPHGWPALEPPSKVGDVRPYARTLLGTPSHPRHLNLVPATLPFQAAAGAAQGAPDLGQWEGQDFPLVNPSLCIVKGGISS